MTTIIILFLLILSLIFYLIGYFKLSIINLTCALLFYVLVGYGFLNALLLNKTQIYPSLNQPIWGQKNAIILLGGGNTKIDKINIVKPNLFSYARIFEAAKFYYSCRKSNNQCKVIVCGGDTLRIKKSEAEISRKELIEVGILPSDIQEESNSLNTYQNAEFSSKMIKDQRFDHVYLVTSGIHMKRSILYFSNFGIKPIPAVSDYYMQNISIIPLGYNFALSDSLIHEYVGILRFYIYNYFGWNLKARKAGVY